MCALRSTGDETCNHLASLSNVCSNVSVLAAGQGQRHGEYQVTHQNVGTKCTRIKVFQNPRYSNNYPPAHLQKYCTAAESNPFTKSCVPAPATDKQTPNSFSLCSCVMPNPLCYMNSWSVIADLCCGLAMRSSTQRTWCTAGRRLELNGGKPPEKKKL